MDRQEDIESHVLNFYENLFASPNTCIDNGLIEEVISPEVSDSDNRILTSLPTWDEVKSIVFGMNANGAPGPDGFGGFFYQNYWDIVGHDVFNSVTPFFKQGWLLPNMNSNTVVLIPKSANADSILDYRPIALANYQFKIITKIIADRLASIAPNLISQNQRGFIKGRDITDCIGVASEVVNLLDKKCFGGNVALKIDIKKSL